MAQACKVNFGVTFDLAEKINVNGDNAHPLYQALTMLAPGALGSKAIKWNFTKFLNYSRWKGKTLCAHHSTGKINTRY